MSPVLSSLIGQRFSMLHPALAELGGTGVTIAVVDSGVHEKHPHVGGVAGGIGILPDGTRSADYQDRWGHGTAVTAVIKERVPDASFHVARVFDTGLATTSDALVAGVEWAVEIGADLVNLSLGTANLEHEARFRSVLERAAERNIWIISAAEHDGALWLPGSLDRAVGVAVDWECERTTIVVGQRTDATACLKASGYPRPIPGLPPERNLRGVSFSVANTTALLARVREVQPDRPLAEALSGYAT